MAKDAAARRIERTHVDDLAADVGRRIRAARLERGMSLADVGGNDLSRSFLSLVELGRSRISLRALTVVAERLELPLSHFLDGEASGEALDAELALDQAEVALAQQEPEKALQSLKTARLDTPIKPRALLVQGRALTDVGRPRDAITELQKGLAVAERRNDRPLVADFCQALGSSLYAAGNYDEAMVYLRRALDEASQGPEDPNLLGKITVCIGHILYVRGDVEGAIEQYTRARDLFGSVSDLHTLGCVYSGLSLAYKHLGDSPSALRYSRLSVAAFEANQNVRQSARELNNLAVRYRELNDLDQGLECAREAVARAREIHDREIEANAHSTLSSIYLDLDDLDATVAEAEAADRLSSSDDEMPRLYAWLAFGEVAARRGDHERADLLYRRALEGLERAGHHTAWADAALDYSLVLKRRGDTEQALEFAVQAAQAKISRTA